MASSVTLRTLVAYLVIVLVITRQLEAASFDATYRQLADKIPEMRSRAIHSLSPVEREVLHNYMSEKMTDPKTKRGVSRRQASVSSLCKGRPIYECNDGLMSVWLRLLKNPDYADE
ncbi:hypothetical protein LSH36_511g01026 [Paralvinella palmiformis]|uniref:Uncharacterized protein n=1 Tax=Paralvinella palmiformis TaxID=53620 RepID=A0AAD9MYA3_9ANNE|nr:hypothetical protein LSH36_511g01026 [Paralvinella palmiformis]